MYSKFPDGSLFELSCTQTHAHTHPPTHPTNQPTNQKDSVTEFVFNFAHNYMNMNYVKQNRSTTENNLKYNGMFFSINALDRYESQSI